MAAGEEHDEEHDDSGLAKGGGDPQQPEQQADEDRSLPEVIRQMGIYPVEAFNFVQHGLAYTVQKAHGQKTDPEANRHVTGRQLCDGLREFALMQWGLMAETVLRRWNVTSTMDFGRIVFAMVDNGFMQRTEQDTIEDFRNVFDFKTAFAAGYKIESKS